MCKVPNGRALHKRYCSKEDIIMTKHLTTLNLDSLVKNAIGVDRFMQDVMHRLDNVNSGNYPPYNIILIDDDKYSLEIALAGFSKDDIEVSVENGQLTVSSKTVEETHDEDENESVKYLYKGISSRSFVRTFTLGEHIEVVGASMENGILHVALDRIVPEALKPKQIEVK